MVHLPRLHLLHCPVLTYRFCKANSPSRNWIINSNKFPRGLPPLYPYIRRGSNTPISSLALISNPPTPSRSRSLDGLFDSEPTIAASQASTDEPTPSQTAKSCDDIEKEFSDENKLETDTCNLKKSTKAHSVYNRLDYSIDNSDIDKSSIYSNSSDSKRKRNFMDRCVNKVRSLIKK
ncbi:uncharacterized protein LOC108916007 [Anoplophora glabripennis]|uniref:uncharacterized protein LOC108916007 n=1 Tax=Anoplophora glabripennis TaxID=217634 RepID=UPI0008741723|nr:uncharacterized protein LOC108916007 [Anoplophora glabripennis]